MPHIAAPSYPANNGVATTVDIHALDALWDSALVPKIVLVKEFLASGTPSAMYLRTDTMPANASKDVSSTGAITSNTQAIRSLIAGGFTIGTNSGVNGATGKVYTLTAIATDGDDVITGSFANKVAGDVITLAGTPAWKPCILILIPEGTGNAYIKTDVDIDPQSAKLPSSVDDNAATALGTGTFTIGSLLAGAGTWHYIAFKAVAGVLDAIRFTGTGTGRTQALGMIPDMVIVEKLSSGAAAAASYRHVTNTGTTSGLVSASANRTTAITAFSGSDGMVLGTDTVVNASGVDYIALAFKINHPADLTAPIPSGYSPTATSGSGAGASAIDTGAFVTDEAAKARLGARVTSLGGAYTYGSLEGSFATSHVALNLGGLDPLTQYDADLETQDALGNTRHTALGPITTPAADTTAPVISGVYESAITSTAATIRFTTNEAGDSRIKWGTTTGVYPNTPATTDTAPRVAAHVVNLTGLTPGDTIYYRPGSADQAGNGVGVWGAERSFLVPAASTLAGMTLGTLDLQATFNTINVEQPWTGVASKATASGTLRFRPVDGTWRDALPLWQVDDTVYRTFWAEALLLTAGTTYQIEVAILDGAGGSSLVYGAATTRTENIATPAALKLLANKYCDSAASPGGNGSIGTPWQTLEEARAGHVAGDIIQVASAGGKWYARPTGTWTKAVTLVAEYPAVDDTRAAINAGNRAIVYSGTQTAPSGDGHSHTLKNVWTSVSLADANGVSRTVWKLAAATHGRTGSLLLGLAATIDGLPIRQPRWDAKAAFDTVKEWLDVLFTSVSFNYGFFVVQAGDPDLATLGLAANDILLRPMLSSPDPNPNNCYAVLSGNTTSYGLDFGVADARVCGLGFYGLGTGVHGTVAADRLVPDHCLYRLYGNGGAIRLEGNTTGPAYSVDPVLQYNLFEDSGYYDVNGSPTTAAYIPWNWIKGNCYAADGTTVLASRSGQENEINAIVIKGGGKRAVVRHNTITQGFNGLYIAAVGYDRHACYGIDVQDLVGTLLADDFIEPECTAAGQWIGNLAIWSCRAENTISFLSTGPVFGGLIDVLRSVGWRQGSHGICQTNPVADQNNITNGLAFKHSNNGNDQPTLIRVNHCTFWTDSVGGHTVAALTSPSGGGVSGGSASAGGSGGGEWFRIRDSIFRTTRYAFDGPGTLARWDEDYNLFATSDAARGLNVGGTSYNAAGVSGSASIAAYRTATGQGAHSNKLAGADRAFVGTTVADAQFAARLTGDLALLPASLARNAGTPIANISDRAGVDYQGAAPDLGASEQSQRRVRRRRWATLGAAAFAGWPVRVL